MLKNKAVFYFAVSFIFLIIDQISKFYVNTTLPLSEKVEILSGILSFEKVYNSGAAFSILQNNTFLIISISILTVILISLFVLKKKNNLSLCELFSFASISGGALGNLADRFVHFYVIDFIKLEFVNFPIFNFADIFINIGVIMLVLYSFRLRHE